MPFHFDRSPLCVHRPEDSTESIGCMPSWGNPGRDVGLSVRGCLALEERAIESHRTFGTCRGQRQRKKTTAGTFTTADQHVPGPGVLTMEVVEAVECDGAVVASTEKTSGQYS